MAVLRPVSILAPSARPVRDARSRTCAPANHQFKYLGVREPEFLPRPQARQFALGDIPDAAEREVRIGATNVATPMQPSHPPRLQVRACSFASGAFAPFAFISIATVQANQEETIDLYQDNGGFQRVCVVSCGTVAGKADASAEPFGRPHPWPNAPNLTRRCHNLISKARNGLRAGAAPGMICIPLIRM
jgi:hypothetical protein